MFRDVAVTGHGADAHAARMLVYGVHGHAVDVHQLRRRVHAHAHEVDKIGAPAQKPGAGLGRAGDRIGHGGSPRVVERLHAPSRCAAAFTASTMPTYAPQRQMLPLMRSRISSSVRSTFARFASSSSATAEQIWPGVQ